MRRILGLAIAMAALLVPAVSANASSLCTRSSSYCSFTDLYFVAGSGETNNVTVSQTGAVNADNTTVTVTDTGSTISVTPNSGCTVTPDGHTATCPLRKLTEADDQISAYFDLGDGNDSLVNNLAGASEQFPVYVSVGAGAGNDSLTGSNSPYTYDGFRGGTGDDSANLQGGDDSYGDEDYNEDVAAGSFPMGGTNTVDLGAGDDYGSGGPGADTIRGGPGDDGLDGDSLDWYRDFTNNTPTLVVSGRGNDTLDGGDGFDNVSYAIPQTLDANGNFQQSPPSTAGAKVTLPDAGASTTGNGVSENDTLTSVEDVSGTRGADSLTGGSTSNVINGNAGNDAIAGGLGADILNGGGDDDAINAADGVADRVNCGGQSGDKAALDQLDAASACPAGATVSQVTPPGTVIPTPADTSPPVLTGVRTPKTVKLATLRKSGYKFKVGTKDTSTVRLIATLTAKVKGFAITSTAGELILAEKRRNFKKSTTTTLKIAKKLQKGLKRKHKLRLLIQLSDQAGNTTPRRVVIKIT